MSASPPDVKDAIEKIKVPTTKEALGLGSVDYWQHINQTGLSAGMNLDDLLVLYAGAFRKNQKRGAALILLDPSTEDYKVLAREVNYLDPLKSRIMTAFPRRDGTIVYGGSITRNEEWIFPLVRLNPSTRESEVLTTEEDYTCIAFPMADDRILMRHSFIPDGERGCTYQLTFFDPSRSEHEFIFEKPISTAFPTLDGSIIVSHAESEDLELFNEAHSPKFSSLAKIEKIRATTADPNMIFAPAYTSSIIHAACQMPNQMIVYGGQFVDSDAYADTSAGYYKHYPLMLLNPSTRDSTVLSLEDGYIYTAMPMPDGKVLYAGAFRKDDLPGYALTLLDLDTRDYKVLARENEHISTAVPVSKDFAIKHGWWKQ